MATSCISRKEGLQNRLGRVFPADVEELLDFSDDGAGFIFDIDGEDSLDLFFGGEGFLDFIDLLIGEAELGENGSASGFLEADARGLVPDDVILAQVFNE